MLTARSVDQLESAARSIGDAGGRALVVAGDVTKREDVERVKRETSAAFGTATLVVHNAGVPWPFGPVWHVDPDAWWEAQAVHVRGAFLYVNAFMPQMMERGGGRIIVVASRAGRSVRPNLSGYAVAKATQIRLVEHVAAEGREHNVYAWSINPGAVFTEISEATLSSPDAQRYLPDFVSRLQQMKGAEDPSIGLRKCADLCVELASGRWDALSGQYLEPEWNLDEFAREVTAAQR